MTDTTICLAAIYLLSIALVIARITECWRVVSTENTRQRMSTVLLTLVPVVNTGVACVVVYLWITEHMDRRGQA